MRRTFQLALPNGLFGDPLVVVRPRLQTRIVLLDAGDAAALSARTLLAVSDVLVSHAHVDHVFGLALLLRLRLGRLDRPLRLFGPPPLAAQVASHLGGYSWNLVDAYPLDLTVIEVREDGTTWWRFPRERGFTAYVEREGPAPSVEPPLSDDLLCATPLVLDHGGLRSLAWRLEEHRALNVDPVALREAGLPTGPWLADVKRAIRNGAAPDQPVEVPGVGARALGDLRETLIRESEGDRIVYVTDVAPTDDTLSRLASFAAGARRLLIETHFLAGDEALARRHSHLTTQIAGALAKRAAPVAVSPLHVSTRYGVRERDVLDEFEDACAPVPVELLPGVPPPDEPRAEP